MTSIGRNDPCPCGSGKKYKRCCLRADKERNRFGLDPEALERARLEEVWQADIVPVPLRLEGSPAARPGVLMITAGEYLVFSDVLDRPSPEAEEMADDLVRGLEEARSIVGGAPAVLEVRFPELVEPLEARIGEGIEVMANPGLPDLDEVADTMVRDLVGMEYAPAASPETWAGWGLPEEWTERLFAAAAGLYRAGPWRYLFENDALTLELSDGRCWVANVLGRDGEEHGVILHELPDGPDSLLAELAGLTPDEENRSLSVLYHGRDDLPADMHREIRSGGWEIAGPRAYPRIVAMGTPAGGLTRADADDLLVSLQALARLVRETKDGPLSEREPFRWRDEDSGVSVSFDPDEAPAPLWDPPAELSPGGPEGPAADLEDRLVVPTESPEEIDAFCEGELEVVERFRASLDGRFAERTVDEHASNAEDFVRYLVYHAAAPVVAVHERDLRTFLFDWYPRKVMAPWSIKSRMPVSLKRFFRFLAADEGLECPWAEAVLAERDIYEMRCGDSPGAFFWEAEVSGWRALVAQDLHERVMLPEDEMADGDLWGAWMGIEEAELHQELEDRWLLWREAVVRGGETDPEKVRRRCAERQREWETTPREDRGGRTPLEVVEKERRSSRRAVDPPDGV